MKCTNCGYETNEDIQFCPVCGAQKPKADNVVVQQKAEDFSNPTPVNAYTETSPRESAYTPPSANTYQPQRGNYVPNQNNDNGYNQQQDVYTGDQKIKNYLTPNVVFLVLNSITLCCCMYGLLAIPQTLILLGSLTVSIIGVVYSAKVNNLIKSGNIQAAINASNIAKKLFYAGMILFIIKIVFFVIYIVFSIASSGDFESLVEEFQDSMDEIQDRYR